MPVGDLVIPSLQSVAARSELRRLTRRVAGLSGLSIAGQVTFLLALPLLSRFYGPTAIGQFTIYLSIVNIAGPLAGCKFEAALFGLTDPGDRRTCLALALLTSTFNGFALAALLAIAARWIGGDVGAVIDGFLLLFPVGFALSGIWAAATAWAVREEALGVLAVARFIQPAAMTALQVFFGLLDLPAPWLALAHVISHGLFAGTIFLTVLSPADRRALRMLRVSDFCERALIDRHFPLFAMPAFAVTAIIGNAPPLLLGALFGADIAGQYGVAYRVVMGPLVVLCQPLSNLFLSEASRGAGARTRAAARFAFLTSIGIALPLLVFGFFAPALSVRLLGPSWAIAGDIMNALAVMAAFQAIAAPFHDVPALYRRPQLRLGIDLVQGTLFFLALAVGVIEQWSAVSTIQLMAAAGAVGCALSAVTTLLLVRTALANPVS